MFPYVVHTESDGDSNNTDLVAFWDSQVTAYWILPGRFLVFPNHLSGRAPRPYGNMSSTELCTDIFSIKGQLEQGRRIDCWSTTLAIGSLMAIKKWTWEESLNYVAQASRTQRRAPEFRIRPSELRMLQRYQRPLTVICAGDRESSHSFRDIITYELRRLPKHSLVLHGDCRGIDRLVAQISQELGIRTQAFPADWSMGPSAGPIRNSQMLEEDIDEVWAFHPDITASTGTADLMRQACHKKVPVYLTDLKGKVRVRGRAPPSPELTPTEMLQTIWLVN